MCDLHHQSLGYGNGYPNSSPQRRVDRIQQSGAGERLFQESYASFQHFAFGDQFPSVARHVYDLQGGVRGVQAFHQFGTAHAAHHDVGQQQINWAGMRLDPFEGGFPIIRLDDRIAVFLEELPSQAAHDVVVFDQEDRNALPSRFDSLDFSFGSDPDFMIRAGEVDLKRRSLSRFAVDQDVSSALLDNPINRGQA